MGCASISQHTRELGTNGHEPLGEAAVRKPERAIVAPEFTGGGRPPRACELASYRSPRTLRAPRADSLGVAVATGMNSGSTATIPASRGRNTVVALLTAVGALNWSALPDGAASASHRRRGSDLPQKRRVHKPLPALGSAIRAPTDTIVEARPGRVPPGQYDVHHQVNTSGPNAPATPMLVWGACASPDATGSAPILAAVGVARRPAPTASARRST
jgi:hypothetical protein